jgi:hypothetical protein
MENTKHKHTPGPWSVRKNGVTVGARGLGGRQDVAVASEVFMSRGEREANACLIATSPRLLSALKAMVENLIPLDSQDQAVVAEANAAIAQALGQ